MTAEYLSRIVTALEQIALELAEQNGRAALHHPAPAAMPAPAPAFQPIGWTCPTHHTVKVVPEGVSHRYCSGGRDCPGNQPSCKPYPAFTVCPEQGCNQKPGKPAAPARAIPPSQGGQLP